MGPMIRLAIEGPPTVPTRGPDVTGRPEGRAQRFVRRALVTSVPVGLLLSTVWVWQGSQAAYTAVTSNSGNTFSAGTVSLTDDDSGTALFTLSGLQPGSTGQRCLTVTYRGTLGARVKLFVTPGSVTGTGLDAYLVLRVEEGSGGSNSSCAGFSGTQISSSTLGSMGLAATNSATGLGTWAPTAAGQSRVYRFTYSLQDDNAAQGLNCQASFTWEATSA